MMSDTQVATGVAFIVASGLSLLASIALSRRKANWKVSQYSDGSPALSPVRSEPLFDRCVEVKLLKDGTVEVRCRLGLWSVSSKDRDMAMREALHYWRQYRADGEYGDLLSNQDQRVAHILHRDPSTGPTRRTDYGERA